MRPVCQSMQGGAAVELWVASLCRGPPGWGRWATQPGAVGTELGRRDSRPNSRRTIPGEARAWRALGLLPSRVGETPGAEGPWGAG